MMVLRIFCLCWVAVAVLSAVQYALPDTDEQVLNFAEGAGDGDGDAFDELDEGFGAGRGSGSGPDDATTYWVTTDESSNGIRNGLTTLTDPEVGTSHIARGRTRKDASGGKQIDHSVTLFQDGLGQLGSPDVTADIDNVWTTRTWAIPTTTTSVITNYALLELRLVLEEVGGGAPRIGWLSAQEFECPDVAGGSKIFIITTN